MILHKGGPQEASPLVNILNLILPKKACQHVSRDHLIGNRRLASREGIPCGGRPICTEHSYSPSIKRLPCFYKQCTHAPNFAPILAF